MAFGSVRCANLQHKVEVQRASRPTTCSSCTGQWLSSYAHRPGLPTTSSDQLLLSMLSVSNYGRPSFGPFRSASSRSAQERSRKVSHNHESAHSCGKGCFAHCPTTSAPAANTALSGGATYPMSSRHPTAADTSARGARTLCARTMTASRPTATVLDAQPQLRILILMDITGSMGGEIKAVKAAAAELVHLSGQEFRDIQLAVAIVAFTEGSGHRTYGYSPFGYNTYGYNTYGYNTHGYKVDGSRCYVSLAEFMSLIDAQQYINNLSLCHPPDNPEAYANGEGDGGENQKAALFQTTELDPEVPTIAFLITDDQPHPTYDTQQVTNALHEVKWLQDRGLRLDVAQDAIRTFHAVLDHWNDNLVLNVVNYKGIGKAVYGSFAQRTGGMLMQPMTKSPAVLARGLTDVVKVLLAQMMGQSTEIPELEGFELMDLSGVNAERQSEQDFAGKVHIGDKKEIFEIAMQRMVAVAGAKFTKRAIGMTAPAEQLEFVYRAARYIYRASSAGAATTSEELIAELTSLLKLRQSIIEQLPQEHRGHFSIGESDIQQLSEEARAAASAAGGGVAPSSGDLSSEAVGKASNDAVAAENWEDWLAVVMRLLVGVPLAVQLPMDKDGKPDFMDCWSSVADKIGVDRMSAAEFMHRIGDKDKVNGPSDNEGYNAFLVLVKASDKLASLVFRIASGTQVLNYVTGVLLGAKGFLPNMYAGIASAALLRLLSRPSLSELEWSEAQQIMHSLRTMHRNAAKPVSEELKAGRANPEDNPSKLLLAAIRCFPVTRYGKAHEDLEEDSSYDHQAWALRLLLQEWLATLMQRHYGKCTPESDAAYLASLREYIPLQLLGPANIDPLKQLHPMEQAGAPDTLQPDYQDQVLGRLRLGARGGQEGERDVPPHPVYLRFSRGARRLLALLRPCTTDANQSSSSSSAAAVAVAAAGDAVDPYESLGPAVETVWPHWEQGVLQMLLLRWRTARYRCTTTTVVPATAAGADTSVTAAAETEVKWEPAGVGSILDLLLARLHESAASQLQGYRKARVATAAEKLVAAAAIVLTVTQHDAAVASAALQLLYLPLGPAAAGSKRPEGGAKGPLAVLMGQQVSLQRNDVPLILEKLLNTTAAGGSVAATAGSKSRVSATVLKALVLGDWCTQGPQALRRSSLVVQLCEELGPQGAEMLNAIKAVEVCKRTGRPNSNGHTAELPYPGPDGYTEQYAAKRRATLIKKYCKSHRRVKRFMHYMKKMRKFTEIAAQAREAAAGDHDKVQMVAGAIAQFDDANQVDRLTAKLDAILGTSWMD